jgi:hypothetical protein
MIPALLAPLAISLLPQAATAIGNMLAGPRGGQVAGELAQVAQRVIGSDDPAEVQERIDTNPDARLEMRRGLEQIMADHALAMAREENERVRLANADRADARAMANANAAAGVGNGMRNVVALATLAIFLLSAAGTTLTVIYNSDSLVVSLVSTIMGATIAGYRDVVGYFLGSSAGSATKERALMAQPRPDPS